MEFPECVVLVSGKRKSGKDHISSRLLSSLHASVCDVLHLSSPLKESYAKEHNLCYEQLMDASEYKERYREDMIRWGEERRLADADYFCRLTCAAAKPCPVWVVADARRPSDLAYFRKHYAGKVITVRVFADDTTRAARGWTFTKGVDDVASECALDAEQFDFMIDNSSSSHTFHTSLDLLLHTVSSKCTASNTV